MPWRVYSVAHARAVPVVAGANAVLLGTIVALVVAVASGGIVTLSRDPQGESADADRVVAHYN
jgi:hypothetical protein